MIIPHIKKMARKGLEILVLGGAALLSSCMDSGSESNPSSPPHESDDPITWSATYYVDGKKGNDKNDGRTPDQAFKTIAKANDKADKGLIIKIRGGEYAENISPKRNGIATDPIMYTSYNDEEVTLTGKKGTSFAIDLKDKENIMVKGINIISPEASYANLTGATGCTIEDSVMSGMSNKGNGIQIGSYGDDVSTKSTRNSIIECDITGGKNVVELITMMMEASENKIKGCRLEKAKHGLVNMKSVSAGKKKGINGPYHNVIEDNEFINPDHHCLILGYGSHDNLIDGNRFLQATDPNDVVEAIHLPGKEIIRFNVITHSGGKSEGNNQGGIGFSSMVYPTGNYYTSYGNYSYHNTIASNDGPGIICSIGNVPDEEGNCYPVETGDNTFKNNIIYGNTDFEVSYMTWQYAACGKKAMPIKGDVWMGNLIGDEGDIIAKISWGGEGGSSKKYTLEEAAKLKNPIFKDNISGYPNFVNQKKDDYHLKKGSPAINNGVFLTSVTTSSNDKEVRVKDARYFIDGWGIVDPDKIQIGNNNPVEIRSIDYKKNILYLSESVRCNEDDGVSLPYEGNAPDIGAFEFK